MNRTVLTLCCLLLGLTAGAQLSELPITLSLPFDEDTIAETEPTFIWQSNLSALQTDPRLSQRLTVVKLLDNQTALEGLAVNNPVFLRENLTSSTLPYSATDHVLENNTWYAWQVSYLMNGMVIGQSDAWRFIRVEPLPPLNAFQPLKDKMDGSVYKVVDDRLNLLVKTSSPLQGKCVVVSNDGLRTEVELQELVDNDFQQLLPAGNSSFRYVSLDVSQYNLSEGINTLIWNSGSQQYKLNFKVE